MENNSASFSVNAEHQNLLSEVRAALSLSPVPAPRALGHSKALGSPCAEGSCGQKVTPNDTFAGQFPACGQQTFPLGMAWNVMGELWRLSEELLYLSGTVKFILGHPCIFLGQE